MFVAAIAGMRAFHFPLLAIVACFGAWWFVTDLLSSGGSLTAVVTLLVGLVFLTAAAALDRGPQRPYGFWVHVAAGLTIGGTLLFWWHKGDLRWSLIAVGGLAYVGLARGTDRSSWAVLGAFGLSLAAGHFAEKWTSQSIGGILGFDDAELSRPWAPAVVFAVLGFLLALLGLLLGRRRAGEPAPSADPGR